MAETPLDLMKQAPFGTLFCRPGSRAGVPGAQVDVAEEEDAFAGVVTACLSVLVLGVETRLDAVLAQMTRLPWASLESVRAPLGVVSGVCCDSVCYNRRAALWQCHSSGVQQKATAILPAGPAVCFRWEALLFIGVQRMGAPASTRRHARGTKRTGGRPERVCDGGGARAGRRGAGGGRRAVAAALSLLLRQAGRLVLPALLREHLPVRCRRPVPSEKACAVSAHC